MNNDVLDGILIVLVIFVAGFVSGFFVNKSWLEEKCVKQGVGMYSPDTGEFMFVKKEK